MLQQSNYASVVEENIALKEVNTALMSERYALKHQLAWFRKQVFGEKSERRLVDDNPHQQPLQGLLGEIPKDQPAEKETITYERGKAKKQRASAALCP